MSDLDNIRPTRESIDAASRVQSGFPEAIEQRAIEVARRAYDMGAIETRLVGILDGQQSNNTEGRNIIRANAAANEVRTFLNSAGYSDADIDARREGVDLLLQAGQSIVTNRVQRLHDGLNIFDGR